MLLRSKVDKEKCPLQNKLHCPTTFDILAKHFCLIADFKFF